MGTTVQPATRAVVRFDRFELHPARGLLLCNGTRVKLQPQPLRVLAHLVARAPSIVSRDELAEVVWPDTHVDLDTSLNFCIRQIRAALNDTASNPRFIETLPKQGYRFVAPVTSPIDEENSDCRSNSLADAAEPTPTPLGDPAPSPAAAATPRNALSLRRPARLAASLLALLAPLAFVVFLHTRPRSLGHRPPQSAPAPEPSPTHTTNPEAHEAYLRGRYLWFRGANEEAGKAFRRAIELDPNDALAWSGLADFYGQGAGESLDPRDALPRSESAARRAVQLNPASADAHLSLGAALYFHRWDFAGAQREIDRALELDPHLAQALHFRAKILSSLERHPEAIAAERAAAEIDPFARPWAIPVRFLLARRYEDARRAVQQQLLAEPGSFDALLSLEYTDCAEKGRSRDCVTTRARRLDRDGNHAASLRLRRTFARGGFRAVLLADLSDLMRRPSTHYGHPCDFAQLYMQLGKPESALHALGDAFEQHDPNLLLVQNLAVFDPLHSDPRYRDLIRHIGLPPAF